MSAMSSRELAKRYFTFVVSIFIIAFGLSGVVRSDLGVSPISSTPYVFSANTPLSIGTYLFLLCLLFIIVQMVLLGREEISKRRFDLLVQVPISFIFGMCTDLTMWILSDLLPESYPAKMAILILGCAMLAVGICLEVVAGVAMMGAECTVQVIARRFKLEFGTVKMFFDITLVCVAIISSLLFAGRVEGIREGTIVTALITGPLVKFLMPRLRFVGRWQESTPCATEPSQIKSDAVLITISREYGSGGHAIGEMLAKRLGVPFYDHNLVEMVAREGNFDESFVSDNEQSLNTSLYNMIMQDYEAPLERSMSPEDLLFVVQNRVINRIAEQGSCVIVGRCSSYILERYPNNISVFLHADIDTKRARVIEQYGIAPDKAAEEIKRIDKARADHFYHYTGKRWGDARSYQICCDTSRVSDVDICDTIESIFKKSTSTSAQ